MTKRQMMDKAETMANETGEVLAVVTTPYLRNSHRIVRVSDHPRSYFTENRAVVFTPSTMDTNGMSASEVVDRVAA